MFGTLCEQLAHDRPTLKEYKTVVSKLKTAQTARNRYIHNGMHMDEQTASVHMAVGSARGTLKVSVDTVGIADIREAAIAIHEAMRALYKLVPGRSIPPIWERPHAEACEEGEK